MRFFTFSVANLAEAKQEKARLMVEVGERVRARGDRVMDAEDQ